MNKQYRLIVSAILSALICLLFYNAIRPPQTHTFMVYYSHPSGFGNIEYKSDEIPNVATVRAIERQISQEIGVSNVVVLNIQQFPIK